MRKILWMIFLVGIVSGCANARQEKKEKQMAASKQPEAVDMHNARNSLDYKGTYAGTIPGEKFKVVQVEIVLTDNEYIMRTTPLQEQATTTEHSGTYTWDNTGSIITLEGVKSGLDKYFVAENQLRQLGPDGKQRVGEEAESYILRKQWE